MSPVEVVTEVARLIKAGRVEEALSLYSDDVVQRSPSAENAGFQIRKGLPALEAVLRADVRNQVTYHQDVVVAQGEWVAVQGRNTGTLQGRQVEQPVAAFFRVVSEKIVEVTVSYDRLGLRRELS